MKPGRLLEDALAGRITVRHPPELKRPSESATMYGGPIPFRQGHDWPPNVQSHLGQLLDEGRLSTSDALAIAIRITDAIASVHGQGIVHRGLEPSKLQLGAEASAAGETAGPGDRLPEDGGNVDYTSPEQTRGEPCDARTDVYALAVIVFELFTGHVPFRGVTPIETLYKHSTSPPPLEGPEADGIPEPVVPVLRSALAKDPKDRFGSAREFGEALRRAAGRTDSAPVLPRAAWEDSEAAMRELEQAIAAPAEKAPPLGPRARPPGVEFHPPQPAYGGPPLATRLVFGVLFIGALTLIVVSLVWLVLRR